MAKQTIPAKTIIPAASTAARADGRTEFHIRPGTAWVNGAKTRSAKTVLLTASEAAYDLSLDRIAPAADPVPARWSEEPAVAAPGADGGADNGGD